jgi:hypothetical protein
MSDMQRAAGPLFAKMREFTQGLTSLQVDVNSIRNIVDYVKVEFDSGIRLVDNDLNDVTKRMDHMMLKLNNESTNMTNCFDEIKVQVNNATLFVDNHFFLMNARIQRMNDRLDTDSRAITNRFDQVDTDSRNRFDQVVLQLESMTSLLRQERERNDTAFSVVVILIAVMLGYIISMSNHMTSKDQYSAGYIPKHNVTVHHRHETVMDDFFMWLFVRPWMN